MKKKTVYIDDEGFEHEHEPIAETITTTKTNTGFEVKYLVRDEYAESPEVWADESCFLVGYHRNFSVTKDEIIPKKLAQNLLADEENIDEDEKQACSDFREKYVVYGLEAYIHSGVRLALRDTGNFSDRKWDVSLLGVVCVDKKECPDPEQAARGLIDTWNQYLSEDVYCIVKEIFDKDKNLVDSDICCGFYGYKYALEELKRY